MAWRKNDIDQGTLVLLVLRTLSKGKPWHGYAITGRIQRRSTDPLRVD